MANTNTVAMSRETHDKKRLGREHHHYERHIDRRTVAKVLDR
jgi:hypothetical protein